MKISKILKQQILFLVCCFSFISSFAQPKHLSNTAEISVLTCGTGAEMYTLFGHTGLRIKDDSQGLDVVYNWGMFDFKTPNFMSKFVKGNLLYYLDVERFDDFVYNYTYDNREIIEQQLLLNHQEKIAVWEEVNRQLKGPDRYYTYGFIQNNCTTKVVDVLNKVLNKKINPNFPSNNHSYRFILNEGLTQHYFEKLGINLLFGYGTNKQASLVFLPVKLKDALTFESSLANTAQKLNHVSIDKQGFNWNSISTLWILVLILGLFTFFKKSTLIYFGITAVFSLFLIGISLFTNHPELHFNVLILLFNPLIFIGLYFKRNLVVLVGASVSIISLLFLGIELIMIILPLILLNFIYLVVLFTIHKKGMISLRA